MISARLPRPLLHLRPHLLGGLATGDKLNINTETKFQTPMLCQTRNGWGNRHQTIIQKGKLKSEHRPNRNKDPNLKKIRADKILRIDLPDEEQERRMGQQDLSPAEVREYFKKKGILPPNSYEEKPIYLSATGNIFEPFVPPEGDGKASIVSIEGAKQSVSGVTEKGKTFRGVRKIRKFDADFDPKDFAEQAKEIYIKAHDALARRDEDALHEYATEKAFPEMVFNIDRKTVKWEYIKSLEPPKVVHIRTQDIITKTNLFAQVTVRFHSQQILAVYDRFGRLIHGHPHVAKDVLEYTVFEKHLANVYGKWRVHGKIIPNWMEAKEGSKLTHIMSEAVEEETEDKSETKTTEDEEDDSEAVYDRFGRKISKKEE